MIFQKNYFPQKCSYIYCEYCKKQTKIDCKFLLLHKLTWFGHILKKQLVLFIQKTVHLTILNRIMYSVFRRVKFI
jgi:hypothetical protein